MTDGHVDDYSRRRRGQEAKGKDKEEEQACER